MSMLFQSAPLLNRPVLLVILDGLGIGRGDAGDAVFLAKTPHLNRLLQGRLSRTLRAHGRAVGMPQEQDMGNSEVGHNTLGAGRAIDQGATRVAEAIKSAALFRSDTWRKALGPRIHYNRVLHFVGLLSDGNVHSHIDHLLALLLSACAAGVRRVRIHILLDGRDVAPRSALHYIARLESLLRSINRAGRDYAIASGGGRMAITMDRYHADWPMVARGYHHHVRAEGRRFASAREAVTQLRAEYPSLTDQDLPGFVIAKAGASPLPMSPGDAVVLFNFRGDRMLQFTQALEDENFGAFSRGPHLPLFVAGMIQYDAEANRPLNFLVSPPEVSRTFGEILAERNLAQFACSETQKFGHVTYFFNGNRSRMFNPAREVYVEVPSLPPPFDAQPKMRAQEIVDATRKALEARAFSFLRINLANADMVAHTGNLSATIEAVEAIDQALGQLVMLARIHGAALCVTADHGNAEEMYFLDPKTHAVRLSAEGAPQPKTSHSLNAVPFALDLGDDEMAKWRLRALPDAGLSSIAATLSVLLDVPSPSFYAPSLIERIAP